MQWRILIFILILNTILALLYLLKGLIKRKGKNQERGHRMKYVLLSIVIFICPLVGVCFLCLSHVLYWIFSKREVDMNDISFSREKIEIHTPADMKRDINIVPMKDVLNISDVKYRRRMLLDVLKKDTKKAMSAIAMAMENEDSETSHYAASVITDALAEFRVSIHNMIESFHEDPQDIKLGILILDNLNEVLRQKVLTGGEKISYVYMADHVGETIFQQSSGALEGYHYCQLTEMFIEIEDYTNSEKWGKRAMEYRPDYVDSYLCNLKLYFKYQDREKFFSCMDKLKSSELAVSKEVMEYIRLFHKEEE